eukprot:1791815-Rhodomonas_salina.2
MHHGSTGHGRAKAEDETATRPPISKDSNPQAHEPLFSAQFVSACGCSCLTWQPTRENPACCTASSASPRAWSEHTASQCRCQRCEPGSTHANRPRMRIDRAHSAFGTSRRSISATH